MNDWVVFVMILLVHCFYRLMPEQFRKVEHSYGFNFYFLINQLVCLHYWNTKSFNQKILIVDSQGAYDFGTLRKCFGELLALKEGDGAPSEEDFLKSIVYKRCFDLQELESVLDSLRKATNMYEEIGTIILLNPSQHLFTSDAKFQTLSFNVCAKRLSKLANFQGFTVLFLYFSFL